MQMGFYFDQTRCIGCLTCVVACKDWNDVPAGPASWRKVTTIERGDYPDLFVAFLSLSCNHCRNPICVSECPAHAIRKREEDGIVIVDGANCLGKECGICSNACPYDALQFGPEEDPKIQKCHFCLERIIEKKKPICVDSCPMRALDAGPLDELNQRYGGITEAEGFTYSEAIKPSIIFKPRKENKGLVLGKVEITPPYLILTNNRVE